MKCTEIWSCKNPEISLNFEKIFMKFPEYPWIYLKEISKFYFYKEIINYYTRENLKLSIMTVIIHGNILSLNYINPIVLS